MMWCARRALPAGLWSVDDLAKMLFAFAFQTFMGTCARVYAGNFTDNVWLFFVANVFPAHQRARLTYTLVAER